MALQGSGAITLDNIRNEFGGANPVSLSQFYRGGRVPGNNGNVPASGSISLSQFYGAVNRVTAYYTIAGNSGPLTLNYWDIPGYVAGITNVIVTVNPGVWVSSNSVGVPALTIGGNWHGGTSIHLVNNGAIAGMGGAGANSGNNGEYIGGGSGGPALNAAWWVTVSNYGWIGGGGGGGGGGQSLNIIGSKGTTGATYYGGGGGGGRGGIYNSAGGLSQGGNNGGAGTTSGAGGGGAASYGSNYGGSGGDYGAGGGAGLSTSGYGWAGGGGGGPAVQGNGYISWNVPGARYGAIT